MMIYAYDDKKRKQKQRKSKPSTQMMTRLKQTQSNDIAKTWRMRNKDKNTTKQRRNKCEENRSNDEAKTEQQRCETKSRRTKVLAHESKRFKHIKLF